MSTDPTIAEVVRRLDEISQRLLDLTNQLRTDYVRHDLYDSHRQADREDTADLRIRMDKSEAQQAAGRRLLITAFVAPIAVALVLLYIAAQIGGATP